jgi:hypothetical protein
VDGTVRVDMEDAAVIRIDGEFCANSFWVRRSHMVQSYKRIGPYWLLASNENDATVRVMGEAHLSIECFDYQVQSA